MTVVDSKRRHLRLHQCSLPHVRVQDHISMKIRSPASEPTPATDLKRREGSSPLSTAGVRTDRLRECHAFLLSLQLAPAPSYRRMRDADLIFRCPIAGRINPANGHYPSFLASPDCLAWPGVPTISQPHLFFLARIEDLLLQRINSQRCYTSLRTIFIPQISA